MAIFLKKKIIQTNIKFASLQTPSPAYYSQDHDSSADIWRITRVDYDWNNNGTDGGHVHSVNIDLLSS